MSFFCYFSSIFFQVLGRTDQDLRLLGSRRVGEDTRHETKGEMRKTGLLFLKARRE